MPVHRAGVRLHCALWRTALQHPIAVMDEIRVHTHPAVGTAIQAGELVPHLGYPAIEAQPRPALDRGMGHVDTDLLGRLATLAAEFVRCQSGRGDAHLRGRADAKGRR